MSIFAKKKSFGLVCYPNGCGTTGAPPSRKAARLIFEQVG